MTHSNDSATGHHSENHGHRLPPGEELRWLDKPANVNKLCIALYIACALAVVGEFFIHKHGYFNFENWFAFHGWFGFLSYCFLIFAAKLLRTIVKRDEGYYDDV